MTPAVICANIATPIPDPAPVRTNLRRHNPNSPFLLGGSLPGDTIHQAAQTSWPDPRLRLEF